MNKYSFRKFKRKAGWILKTSYFTRNIVRNYIVRKNAHNFTGLLEYIETAEKVLIDNCSIKLGIVKDADDFSFNLHPSWPVSERFAKNNNISYSLINIHCSDWQKECQGHDIIVWRPSSDPDSLYEEITKIYYLEKFLKIRCHPSFNEFWTYDDKIRLHYHLTAFDLPVIPTLISFDEKECLRKIDSLEFPLISKSHIGSSSICVSKLNSKLEARKHIRKVFSRGLDTGFPYFRQKGYVFFQKFIADASYDLRIIMVGQKIFGYYRMKPKNDFRASGGGLVVKDELPLEAVLLARKVKEIMPSTILAVDMLKSEADGKFYIIETSIDISIETPEQLKVNNIPGFYLLVNGNLEFHKGKYWLQELLLEELISNHIAEAKRIKT